MVGPARKTILVFGSGVIGGQVTDLLARMNDRFKIVLASRHAERLKERANLAITVAMNLGFSPQITNAQTDVRETARTAALIDAVKPDLIVNATSLQTFWAISKLPQEWHRLLLQANIGPWLPNHLATARALMRAVVLSGTAAPVVNAAFPDAVNAALSKVGLAPLVGGGNIANLIPTLERAAARQLGIGVCDMTLRFAAHHVACNAISSVGSPTPAPCRLSILADGEELSGKIEPATLFSSVVGEFRRVRGVPGQIVAASAVAATVSALLDDDNIRRLHVPGPHGLPGGYPAFVGAGAVVIDCSGSFDRDEAVLVNEAGQICEGIEEIRPDGTIVFSEREMAVLTGAFGYRCEQMHVDDVDEAAAELGARYQRFAERVSI